MNIFITDIDPIVSAINECDRHIVKMPTESAQILSAVQRICGNNNPVLYKVPTGNKIPIQWVLQGRENYLWLLNHYIALCNEYTKRYKKFIKSGNKQLVDVLSCIPNNLPKGKTIPLCSTKDIHLLDRIQSWKDAVDEYRYFYFMDKNRFAKWNKGTEMPNWYKTFLREQN
jgi:hypothetical protein